MKTKTKLNKAIAVMGYMLFVQFGIAQDFHLSQYDANPLYLNPALTGLRTIDDWDFRMNANYREQKSKNLTPFTTIAAGFDMPVNENFSIGEYVIDNKGAEGTFNSFNAMASGSYNIIPGKKNSPHTISVGLQVGLLQKSFNPKDYVYDSQYSPDASDGFDETLPAGENFSRQSFFRFDANIGIHYSFTGENKKHSYFGGFSIYHLTQPDESFTNEISNTPMRFVLHGGFNFALNEAIRILPQAVYMKQANAKELNLGIILFCKIPKTDFEPIIGFAWRDKDAIIIHAGLKKKKYIFRMSYDSSTSELSNYGKNGMELSLIFMMHKKTLSPAKNSPVEKENTAKP